MHSIDAALRATLARAEPSIIVHGGLRHVSGYVNDLSFFDSSVGAAVAKIRNIPEEDPEQIRTYLETMALLQKIQFPTPGLLLFEESCEQLDGRQLSVLSLASGVVANAAGVRSHDQRRMFRSLGQMIGRLHSIDLPSDTVWRDDSGAPHSDWTGVVLSSLAEAEVELEGRAGDHASTVDEAVALLRRDTARVLPTVVTPRLVHRDLHLGNVLVDHDLVSALLDFEMVREWDAAYDFVKIRGNIYSSHPAAESSFLKGYREQVPAADGFDERVQLYVGLHHLLSAVEFLNGNDHYRGSLVDLQRWLAGR